MHCRYCKALYIFEALEVVVSLFSIGLLKTWKVPYPRIIHLAHHYRLIFTVALCPQKTGLFLYKVLALENL